MLKSIGLSIAVGVVVGLGLSAGALLKGMDVDGKTTLIFCGIGTFACLLLSVRESFQARSLAAGREMSELEGSSDPLIAIIHAEKELSFKHRAGVVTSESFDINWVLNSTTMDINTSVISLTLKKGVRLKSMKVEVNRIARQCCGGNYLRTQTVGVLIRDADRDLKVKSLVDSNFFASSGIIWALCVNDNDRVVDALKTPHQVKTDQVYLNLLGWFVSAGFTINSGPEKRRNPVFE